MLTALAGMDPARVYSECRTEAQCTTLQVWSTPNNALGAVLSKEPATLTREDALTVAWSVASEAVGLATPKGLDAIAQCLGTTSIEVFSKW